MTKKTTSRRERHTKESLHLFGGVRGREGGHGGKLSGKRHVHLWTSLTSLQRRKDAKDSKKPRLSKVMFLSLQRHFTSFKDGEYLSEMEGIFQRHLIFFQRC